MKRWLRRVPLYVGWWISRLLWHGNKEAQEEIDNALANELTRLHFSGK